MRAYVIDKHGGPEEFHEADLPRPEAGPGQVLLAVRATSYNPIEAKIRQGLAPIGPDFPAVLNSDVAGVVQAVGEGVSGWSAGDEVFACGGGIKGAQGALAEYTALDARLLAKKPASLDFAQTASLPIAAITSWQALVDKTNVREGQRVLVQGGTGGVGHLGVQLAKILGAEVHATCGTDDKCKLARELGASEAFNYRNVDPESYAGNYDVVFDTVGGKTLDASFAAAKPGGQVVTINARNTHDLTPVHVKALSLHVVMMLMPMLQGRDLEQYPRILSAIAEHCDAGRMRPVLDDKRFDFAQVEAAHRYAAEGVHVGKIALTP